MWLSRIRYLALATAAAATLAGCASESTEVLDRVDSARVPHKSAFSGTVPGDFSIHGIDVSKYQGDVNWRSVRDGGVQFAWIKATEGGDRVDPKFWQNWEGAKAAGVARGAYHFVYWCRPWQEEVAWFERTVPNDPDALPPVLDVEATPGSRTCKRTLYREQVLPELRAMLSELERHYGKRPVIYSSVDFYQAILAPSELDDYPIWIRSTKYSPPVKYGNRAWHFWQYQSDGSVPGIAGKVDRNAFFGDRKQWVAWLQRGDERRGPVPPTNAVAAASEELLPMSPQAPIPRAPASQAPIAQAAPVQTSALQPMQLLPMSLNDGPHY